MEEESKMVAERPLHEAAHIGITVLSPWDSLQEEVYGGAPIITSLWGPTSPASTVSLNDHTLDDMLMSPSAVASSKPNVTYQDMGLNTSQPHDISLMFTKFA